MSESRNTTSPRARAPRAARLTPGAAALALLAACSDAPTSPAAGEASSLAPRGPHLSVSASSSGSTTTFTYGPGTSVTLTAGGYRLALPSNAICEPTTSGYGPGTWDLPCETLRRPISISVRTWTDADGRPGIRFTPDVRFVPSKTVTLALHDRRAARDPRFTFVWCPSAGGACINESLTDPEVATHRDPTRSYVYARIKHFSGYNVIAEWGDGGSQSGF
jgi:hypothetical protein